MKKPLIGIIMGSDSDLPVMKDAAYVVKEFSVPFEITIVSAHRTPDRMVTYATSAEQRGIQVIIAGAGGSAHLPGMVAAFTPLPVIGVPIQSKTMSGIDSLYSIVQMPPGIPVATVAINGAKNAGILALKMLAISDSQLRKKLLRYTEHMKEEVLVKAGKLEDSGYTDYLKLLAE